MAIQTSPYRVSGVETHWLIPLRYTDHHSLLTRDGWKNHWVNWVSKVENIGMGQSKLKKLAKCTSKDLISLIIYGLEQ